MSGTYIEKVILLHPICLPFPCCVPREDNVSASLPVFQTTRPITVPSAQTKPRSTSSRPYHPQLPTPIPQHNLVRTNLAQPLSSVLRASPSKQPRTPVRPSLTHNLTQAPPPAHSPSRPLAPIKAPPPHYYDFDPARAITITVRPPLPPRHYPVPQAPPIHARIRFKKQ